MATEDNWKYTDLIVESKTELENNQRGLFFCAVSISNYSSAGRHCKVLPSPDYGQKYILCEQPTLSSIAIIDETFK